MVINAATKMLQSGRPHSPEYWKACWKEVAKRNTEAEKVKVFEELHPRFFPRPMKA